MPTLEKRVVSIIGFDRAGKDTAANIVKNLFFKCQFYETKHFKNADILKSLVCKFHGIDEADYEFFKRSEAKMNGKTLREWMVFFAQSVYKPVLGDEFFAKQTSDKIMNYLDLNDNVSRAAIKSDDRYIVEFDSNDNINDRVYINYILLLKNEEECEFFFEKDLNSEDWTDKPYMIDLHTFVNKNKHKIDIVYNNGSIEDLAVKLHELFCVECGYIRL